MGKKDEIEKLLLRESERIREAIENQHRSKGDVRIIYIPKRPLDGQKEIEATSLY